MLIEMISPDLKRWLGWNDLRIDFSVTDNHVLSAVCSDNMSSLIFPVGNSLLTTPLLIGPVKFTDFIIPVWIVRRRPDKITDSSLEKKIGTTRMVKIGRSVNGKHGYVPGFLWCSWLLDHL